MSDDIESARSLMTADDKAAQTTIKIVDGVFQRVIHLRKAGETNEGHSHTWNHPMTLIRGEVKVETQVAIEKPAELIVSAKDGNIDIIRIPKGVAHTITALVDDCVLLCIHAVRSGDDLTDIAPADMPQEVYFNYMSDYPLITK